MALFLGLRYLGSEERHEGYYTKLRSLGRTFFCGKWRKLLDES